MSEIKVHHSKYKINQKTLSKIFQNKEESTIQFEMKRGPVWQIPVKYENSWGHNFKTYTY